MPSPAPTPSAAPTGGPGALTVNSRPWSNITLDGKPVGTTFKGEVPAGRHALVLTTQDGRTKSASVTVREGAPTRFCWDFESDAECGR